MMRAQLRTAAAPCSTIRKVGNSIPLTSEQLWVFKMRRFGADWKIDEVSASPAPVAAVQRVRGQEVGAGGLRKEAARLLERRFIAEVKSRSIEAIRWPCFRIVSLLRTNRKPIVYKIVM